MSAENDAIQTITKVIKTACERIVATAKYDKTMKGVVVGLPNNNSSLYTVQVNGARYDIPNCTNRELFMGSAVYVLSPCNNYANMFILAKC